jgi:hypothetical protein
MEPTELSSTSSWLHWLSIIKYVGGGMVVVGVAAELLGDWFSEPLQKKLDDARKLEIAQLSSEGQRLAKEAESERLERVKLEAEIAPRRLSNDQIEAVGNALAPFAGKTVDVGSYAMDGEALPLARQLLQALSIAGIIPADRTFAQVPVNKMVTGVQVGLGLNPEHPDESARLAAALREVLDTIDDLKAGPELPTGPLAFRIRVDTILGNGTDASIFVGIKPLAK